MKSDTDVLIIGAGPTGLMMACQLLRFGVSFRIIDKQADRAHESRAFAIQAKTMEILQNLGLADEFLRLAQSDPLIHFYINGKQKAAFSFGKIAVKDTPFPSIYFLPQSETERILIEHLEGHHIKIERQTNLLTFSQNNNEAQATIENILSHETENIQCQYIIGCDGAHSAVRHILKIPFEGAEYEQEFILADASVEWSFPPDFKFMAFLDKTGLLLHIPLGKNLSRLMGASFKRPENSDSITELDVKNFAEQITRTPVELSNVVWMSRFHLHHRAVKHYQINRAFLAGDAAHIHSPVGGQGMNTGLQDATNLAWKIALAVKKNSPKSLLETYQLERQRVGEVLVKTTDRIFGFMTAKNFLMPVLRPFLLSIIMPIIAYSPKLQNRLFLFISQLAIHYHENQFVYEEAQGADRKFLSGPRAGCRAPDAPLGSNQTLFDFLKEKPFNILIFGDIQDSRLNQFDSNSFAVYQFKQSPETQILFNRYGISTSGIYFIRPDGYIGFRSYGNDLDALWRYIRKYGP